MENEEFDNTISITNGGIPYGSIIDEFTRKCMELRIIPYDINDENLFFCGGKVKAVDVHKWKRSYSVSAPSVPKYVRIELNNNCNTECRIRNIPHMEICNKLMSDNLFVKILKEINENGIEYIILFLYGELSLKKIFIEKIKMINEFAPKTKIIAFTSVPIFENDKIDELISVRNIVQFIFCFSSENRNIYKEIEKFNYWHKCKYNIEIEKYSYFLLEGYPCSIYVTYNYSDDIQETLTEECYEHCNRAFRSMTITYDGKVRFCCMDLDNKYIMGDVSINTMLEIWNSDNYVNLRRLHGICRNACEPCAKCTLDLKTEEYNHAYSNNNM